MRGYFLIFGAAVLSLASCNNKEAAMLTTGDSVTSQLQIQTDEYTDVRSSTNRYAVEAYTDEDYTTPANIFAEGGSSSVVTTSSSIEMSLTEGESYHLLLWADNGASYDVTYLKNVSLMSDQEMSEAWQGTLAISDNSNTTYSASLTRAVAKVNLNETQEFYSPKLTIEFEAYSGFNVAEGDVAGDAIEFSSTYSYTTTTTGLLNSDPIYVFAPVATASVVDFVLSDIDDTFSLTNVPVQANYVTTLNGHFSVLFASSITANTDDEWLSNPEAPAIVEFKDSAFEAAVLDALGKIEGEVVTFDDALTLTSLSLNSKGITDMTGINSFTNLTSLTCTSNNLTSLDVSELVNLTVLQFGANTSLTEVVYPSDPSKIVTLYVYNTAITELDLTSGFTSLKTLYAYDCLGLKTINFRSCSSMTTGNIARCYNMETVYLNEGQTDSGSWVFKEITECTFICISSSGVETEYASGTITGTWN